MNRTLVLDANQRSALAVTRSLGEQGKFLITADETPTSLSGRSRYSQKYHAYPSPSKHADGFVAAIAELCRKENISIVFPMTELTTTLLLRHSDQLPGITLPFADISSVDALSDKFALMQLAESLDVPIPKTWYVNSPNKLPVNLDKMQYPLVLKPGKSWIEDEGEWLHTSVRFADSPSESESILAQDPAFKANPFLLQESVPGKGEGVFALYDRGKPVAFFAHKRLREKPPRGGVSVLSASAAVDPKLLSYSRSLLDHVGWHGIAMVEFRVEEDGTAHLMEINTRFWGSLQLAVDAGVNFPWLLYQIAIGETVSPNESYKIGKRLRWLLGDLDWLYLTLRDKEFSFMDKAGAILKFLTPHPFITRHQVNRWGDLKPFLWELKQYLRDLRG
jgi:predicted ATP-grasp superfamily ATP-dependent carboligase